MKTYLKNEEQPHQLLAFDHDNFTRIEIYRESDCSFEQYDDKADFTWSLNYSYQNGYIDIFREEFNAAYINFTKKLNNIAKEL